MSDTIVPVTTKKDWTSDQEVRWCPGCGDYGILLAVQQLMPELGVAPETIKTHLKRIFQKLSAESRAQAVVRAQSLGMLKTNGHHAAL